jgi:hypothetical protein
MTSYPLSGSGSEDSANDFVSLHDNHRWKDNSREEVSIMYTKFRQRMTLAKSAFIITAPVIAVAAAIAVAPSAFAQPGEDCQNGGGSVVCQTPGNSEIYSSPQSTTGGMGIGTNGPYGPWGNVPPEG